MIFQYYAHFSPFIYCTLVYILYKKTWGILFCFLFYRRFIRARESEKCDFERNHAVKPQSIAFIIYIYLRFSLPTSLFSYTYIYIYICLYIFIHDKYLSYPKHVENQKYIPLPTGNLNLVV